VVEIEKLDGLAVTTSLECRVSDQQRHVDQRVVETELVTVQPVFTVELAVVGTDDDGGLVPAVGLAQPIEQPCQLPIDVVDLGIVEPADIPKLGGRDIPGPRVVGLGVLTDRRRVDTRGEPLAGARRRIDRQVGVHEIEEREKAVVRLDEPFGPVDHRWCLRARSVATGESLVQSIAELDEPVGPAPKPVGVVQPPPERREMPR